MAARYWVGGTGNWSDDTNHWATSSGGTAGTGNLPTSSDNVTFDSLSNATAYTVTIDATANCADMTWGNPLVGSPTLAGSSDLNIYGSLSLVSGMGRTYTGNINFVATSTGKTITSNTVRLRGNITFDGVGGGWIFQDDFDNTDNGAQSNAVDLRNGSVDTNSKTMKWGQVQLNNSTTTRSLTLGTSILNIGIGWSSQVTTGLTFSGANSTINLGINSVNADFLGGGLNYNIVAFENGGGGWTSKISGSNTFSTLTLYAGATYIFTVGTTQTVTNFTPLGTAGNLITLQSSGSGSVWTISKSSGTVSGDYLSISDSTATGGATWNAGTHSTNGGNNLGWFFTYQPVNVFDSATIAETVTANMSVLVNLSDNITVAENVTAEDFFDVSVVDNITIAESTTTSPTTTTSVSDNINVSENIVSAITTWFINVSDNITVQDTISSIPTQLGSTSDNITVSESISAQYSNLVASVFDSITVSEFTVFSVNISVVDNVTVSESVGKHRVLTGWSTNWTADSTIPTTKWKKDPN